nr:transcription repressor OFP7 [Ipomoea trifida]
MGKGFRLEISKLISSFKSCRSKDPSSLPNNPVPLSHAHKPSIRATPNDLRKERREFRWRKEEDWHVVAVTTSHDNNKPTPRRKISNSSLYEETLAAPPPPEKRNRRARKTKKVIAGVGKRDAGEAVGVQEADTVQPGGEGEGELCDGEEIEGPDLEQLLQCFLSLNTRQYHGIIVEVFSEIWEALFCTNNNSSDENSEGSRMSAGNRRKRAVC